VHLVVAWAITTGFGILMLWSAFSLLANKTPAGAFWKLLAALQVALGLQIALGVTLFVMGGRPPWLHYVYGGVVPLVGLVIAHRYARRHGDLPWVVFGVASFFICASAVRALMTGLGD
jgi:hypothetical protein